MLYIRVEGGVGKNRIVNAIHTGFSILKKQKELLIATATSAVANNSNAIIYKMLNIHDHF